MKHKNQNSVCQSINPFLGFRWSTGIKFKKGELNKKPQEYIYSIAEANK
ncbi:hypothetical protein [Jejuia spongiicola]|uniref:Uncharacterized protein n=1 Tax=Jejuia spongiicola TaxID=2942207 RepID=A0ABT0QDZ0_9FLAO|nr:hypothetical protein [Jejuia spongiicola]MCL6295202.1 hypothetical protein [Jejuia spongiicola]